MLDWTEDESNKGVDKMTDEQLEARKTEVERKLAALQESSRKLDDEVQRLNCDLWFIAQERVERLRKSGKSEPEAVRLFIDTYLLVDANEFGVSRQAVREWLRALPGVKKIDVSPTVECDYADGGDAMFDCEWEE